MKIRVVSFFYFLINNPLLVLVHRIYQPEVISEYFTKRNVFVIDIVMCHKGDSISLWKYLQQRNHSFLISSHSLYLNWNPDSLNEVKAYSGFNRQGIFVDLTCTKFDMLQQDLDKYFLNSRYFFLFWSDSNRTFEIFLKSDWINSDVTLALAGSKDDLTFYKVYKTNYLTHTFETIKCSNCCSNSDHSFKKTANLSGLTLHGSVSLFDTPLDKKSTAGESSETRFSPLKNFLTTVYGHLRVLYNFKWELHEQTNKFTKNELVEFVGNEFYSIDFIITSEKLSRGIINHSKLLPAIASVRQCFMFLHPPIYSFPTFYLKPLSYDMWICVAVLVLTSTLFYCMICCFDIDDWDNNEITFSGSLLLVLGILSNQGLISTASRASKRMIQFTLLQFDVIMWCFYGAIILNYLIHPTHQIINDINDLKSEGFIFGKENIAYNDIPPNEILGHSSMTDLMEFSNSFNLSFGVEKMRTSKFAFFTIDTNIHQTASEVYNDADICRIKSIPTQEEYKVAMILRNHSPFKDHFQKGILLLKEVGIIDRENKAMNKWNLLCSGSVYAEKIGFHSILFAGEIFCVGVVLSLLLLLVEVYFYKFHKLKINFL